MRLSRRNWNFYTKKEKENSQSDEEVKTMAAGLISSDFLPLWRCLWDGNFSSLSYSPYQIFFGSCCSIVIQFTYWIRDSKVGVFFCLFVLVLSPTQGCSVIPVFAGITFDRTSEDHTWCREWACVELKTWMNACKAKILPDVLWLWPPGLSFLKEFLFTPSNQAKSFLDSFSAC